jgi:hypothetical protein
MEPMTLSEMGIDKKTSMIAQQLAALDQASPRRAATSLCDNAAREESPLPTPPRRRPGRPPLGGPGDQSVDLHVRLSSAQFDASCAQASAARLPLATWARRILRDALRPPRDPRR